MKLARKIYTSAVSLMLISCASNPDNKTSARATDDGNIVSSERLAPRTLEPGACGLFVWTADSERRFILFSQSDSGLGAWASTAGEVPLRITDQSGSPRDSQYPTITYQGVSGEIMKLGLRDPETIVNGTRYKGGSLRITAPDGWERVEPVIGLSACQLAN